MGFKPFWHHFWTSIILELSVKHIAFLVNFLIFLVKQKNNNKSTDQTGHFCSFLDPSFINPRKKGRIREGYC